MMNLSFPVLSLLHKTTSLFLLDSFIYSPQLPSPCFLSSTWLRFFPFHPLKGFLQITPEGSPQAQRKGEVGGEVDVLGSFCLHTSGLDLTSQEMSEEQRVSSSMVTKTTRITRHVVTTETQAGETSATTTTTHQVSDFKFWGWCNDILNVLWFSCFLW